MGALHLSHDVIDAQLVDRQQEKIGRIDELLLELEDGQPPRVATIVIGGVARARRVGRWMLALHRAVHALFGHREEQESRVPFDAVRRIADTIELDVEGDALASMRLERWLATHIVLRIPGGSGERK
ncbi:MAG: PRC-barrel domain-containing protein [Gemmatimonadetes bacterium]|nr:PRC-barrel domain-containing protein [Gemmatimonadota bacterium]